MYGIVPSPKWMVKPIHLCVHSWKHLKDFHEEKKIWIQSTTGVQFNIPKLLLNIFSVTKGNSLLIHKALTDHFQSQTTILMHRIMSQVIKRQIFVIKFIFTKCKCCFSTTEIPIFTGKVDLDHTVQCHTHFICVSVNACSLCFNEHLG